MEKIHYFTSESVTEGHPDKIADQISDGILDHILAQDPHARVACETTVTTGLVLVAGEISTSAYVDIQKIVRQTVDNIGYNNGDYGFDSKAIAVLTAIDEQSPDIAQGVDHALETRDEVEEKALIGAGDQGLMFGYATNETASYLPLPIDFAHRLARRLAEVRKTGLVPYLRPDGKTQVTIAYDEQERPLYIDTIVISSQHNPDVSQEQLVNDVMTHVIQAVVSPEWLTDKTKYFINPTGRFVIGGPVGDAGLTGRKIIVDTYGGYARHGGGAFSGKDATKVDRSAAYAARYIAKNLVAAQLADKVEIQLAYAIGVAHPVSIAINTFETGRRDEQELIAAVRELFDLTPAGIIDMLQLRQPIYQQTAAYGHFGRNDLDLPWERLDKVEQLRTYFAH